MSSVAAPARAPARTLRFSRLNDDRLGRLVENGSERAFAALYERYHQQLYRYCRSILLNDSDAQDALQSTFAAALSAMQRGKRNAPVRPWLFRIAHNEAISLIRRRRAGDSALADELASAVAAGSVEAMVDERARFELLIADLHELPERQRSALVMRELSGLSHGEIALALGTSLGAAKQAIFDARCGLLEQQEGRAMPCDEVLRAISDGDGRVLRGRRVRAHVRGCARCAAFAAAIPARQGQLRALAPVLPPVTSVALLARALRGAPAHGGSGASGAATAGAAGKTIAAAVASKAAVGAAVLVSAAAGIGGATAVLHSAHHHAGGAAGSSGATTPAVPNRVNANLSHAGIRRARTSPPAATTFSAKHAAGRSAGSGAPASRSHRRTAPGQTVSQRGHVKTPPGQRSKLLRHGRGVRKVHAPKTQHVARAHRSGHVPQGAGK